MTAKKDTASFAVDQSPDDVFAAVKNVRGWWSGEIDGRTDKLCAEFTYRYKRADFDCYIRREQCVHWLATTQT